MLQRINIAILLTLAAMAGPAKAGPELGSGGGGTFAFFNELIQDWVDFMTGPYAKAAVIGSIILAFAGWSYAPKEGIMGHVIRIVVSGIVILNVGAWMGALQD